MDGPREQAGAEARVADRAGGRQEAILEAAFTVFANYGFRRTSMDDIARAAGVSRPALYRHWANKEDLFRSLVIHFTAEIEREVCAVLSRDGGDPAEVLAAAFAAKSGRLMEAIQGTPHGSELMEVGFRLSADLVEPMERRLEAALAAWVARRGVLPGADTPESLAALMMAALRGLKTSGRDAAGQRAMQAQLARVFARSLAR